MNHTEATLRHWLTVESINLTTEDKFSFLKALSHEEHLLLNHIIDEEQLKVNELIALGEAKLAALKKPNSADDSIEIINAMREFS